jgi:hypothetical protein
MRPTRFVLVLAITVFGGLSQSADAASPTAYDVCKQFRARSLEANPCRRMTASDWGLVGRPRNAIEGRRFVVESLCDEYEDPCDSGGRVMRFKTMGALRAQKAYYDGLGKKGSLFFSWTFVNRQHLLLVQINGELPEARALKYKAALAAL